MYVDVHNTCLMYIPAHAWCSQHLLKCMHTLHKNAHALVHARLCNGAEASLPCKLLRTYLESCTSIVQTVVCRLPSYCLDEISRLTLFAQEIRRARGAGTSRIHALSSLVLLHRFVGDFGTIQTKEGSRGRKPASKKLLVRLTITITISLP